VGAGIMMQPSGLLVLERLGLAGHILARGAPVDRLVCETAAGRKILDLRYEALAPGLHGVGLHRGVLFEALYHALREPALGESAVRTRCGVSVERIGQDGDRVAVVDAEGARWGPFDLVVVADGARSRVRDAMSSLAKSVRPYAWVRSGSSGATPARSTRGAFARSSAVHGG
jgi:2-polyprenyl-6-methoxyphenol hydroxylase-like FAD-dependent oxidoreductase